MRDLTPQSVRVDSYVDIQLEPNGDLKLLPNGDIALCDDIDSIEQAIRWRILTQLGSWPIEPWCGTDLEAFAGSPNNQQTAEMLRTEVMRALAHDEFLMADEVEVHVAPVSQTKMTVVMLLTPGMVRERAAFRFEYDLVSGELSAWERIV